MSILSNLELIKRVPLFSTLTNSQAAAIAENASKRRYKKGEYIVEQGKKSNSLYILLSGRAKVTSTDTREREVILANLQVGDYIGEMSLIDNEPHSANVIADGVSDVLVLGRNEFARCLPENTSLAYSVMRGLVQRLRAADIKIESLALMDVYGRVAKALMDLYEVGGKRMVDNKKAIYEKVSRQDLAKMVGASREMVSRVMKHFEDRAYIKTQDDGTTLLDDKMLGLTHL